MARADTTSTVLYAVAYCLQLVAVISTVVGLWRLGGRHADDLRSLWDSHPSLVVATLRRLQHAITKVDTSVRDGARRIGVSVHLLKRRSSALAGSAGVEMSAANADLTVRVTPPGVFDAEKDIAPQFNQLAAYARGLDHLLTDMQNRLDERIDVVAAKHEVAVRDVNEKLRDLSFGDFVLTCFGVGLLLVSVALEIAANFT